jgi:hypothetical protein
MTRVTAVACFSSSPPSTNTREAERVSKVSAPIVLLAQWSDYRPWVIRKQIYPDLPHASTIPQ